MGSQPLTYLIIGSAMSIQIETQCLFNSSPPVPLEFQSKKKSCIFCHSTAYLYCISVLTNSVNIAGSSKCSMNPLSKLITCILSAINTIRLQSYCDTSYSRDSESDSSIHHQGPFHHVITLKHLISLPSTHLFLTQS